VKARPEPARQTTTLWDFPSQNYGDGRQGDTDYAGATPSFVVWNLLTLYTRERDLVVDPMCGSGTTLDVARDLDRRALGYDLQPTRRDIFRADARKLPLEPSTADFVFVDPPYSDHLKYSGKPECIGELSAFDPAYFDAMAAVIAEIDRILKNDRYLALYVGDTCVPGRGFVPIGTKLHTLLCERFTPVDTIAVVRRNRGLHQQGRHRAAEADRFLLRGFLHLFVMAKGDPTRRLV
jgi:adenine-specific DNA-methyltransferase